MLSNYLKQIDDIFSKNGNRYEIHKQCQPILAEMSKKKEILYDIIRLNIENPEFLKKERHYSTLAMQIMENPEYTIVLNIFPPLPDRNTEISFQSIHHHGNLILSTVSAFGPGYNSILFKKGFKINYQTNETKMEMEKIYQNQLYQLDFVDCHQPHIVFYPKDFSATLVLWSDFEKKTKDSIKKIGIINKFKKPIATLINKMGLNEIFGLNNIKYYDFYTENNKIFALKEREKYSVSGSNDNFLQNIFCFIQKTGFNESVTLNNLLKSPFTPIACHKYIKMILNNEPISDHFFEGHLNIPKVNLNKQDILNTLT